MNKWIILAWVIFLGFIGSVCYLAQRVPERLDNDSIVKQYKITINESALETAKDERTPPVAPELENKAENMEEAKVEATDTEKPTEKTTDKPDEKPAEEINVTKVK